MRLITTGAGILLAFFFSLLVAQASEPSVATLKQHVANAQKQVAQAQRNLDRANGQTETGTSPSEKREKIEDSKSALAKAQTRLDQAKDQLRVAQQKIKADDSSQATQPENRTQNGSNFSIRSQRDSENHPPLPASQ